MEKQLIKVICSIIKDEQRYIKEWVDYHLNIGFDRIYLFEDYGSTSHKELFKDYSNVIIQTAKEFGIDNYHSSKTQLALYKKFLREAKGKYDWILFTDVDEFLVFEEGYNLEKLIEEYKDVPALWLSWCNIGACGHIRRPEGNIMGNYTNYSWGSLIDFCNKWNKKSLVNVNKNRGFINVHEARGGVDTNGNDNLDFPLVYKKAWINHYFTKSWEDYCERMFKRGNMSNNYRTFDNFFHLNYDLLKYKKDLIFSILHKSLVNTMWISKDLKIMSGGNLYKIYKLENKFKNT